MDGWASYCSEHWDGDWDTNIGILGREAAFPEDTGGQAVRMGAECGFVHRCLCIIGVSSHVRSEVGTWVELS
jgi:hypothetical protein